MKRCNVKNDLVAFLYGELAEEEMNGVRRHLETCQVCREDMETFRRMLDGADSIGREIEESMKAVDWQRLPDLVVDRVLQTAPRPKTEPKAAFKAKRRVFLPFLFKPVYAGLLIGLIIGAAGMFFVLRGRLPLKPGAERYYASQEFLENVDQEMARRDTVDYLNRSQDLILGFFESGFKPEAYFQEPATARKTQELLSKKKFLNPQLDKFRLAKAKEICDQIELLMLELTQLSKDMTPEQMEDLRRVVEEKNLLLKIKLVRNELQGSEV